MKRSKNKRNVDKRAKHTPAVQYSEHECASTQKALEKNIFRNVKTSRGRRFLSTFLPRVHEDPKTCLFLRGSRCSNDVKQLLTDISMIRKPYSTFLTRKQINFNILEDHEPIEFLCKKNNTALFCFGSSTKQHPTRLIMGRVFDDKVFDMYECDVENYISLKSFLRKVQPVYGTKPLVLAVGAEFETSESFKHFRNFLLDFFSSAAPQKVLVRGIDQVIMLIALPGSNPSVIKVFIRRFRLTQSQNTLTDCNVSVEEVGPSFSLCLASFHLPDNQTLKLASKQPKLLKPAKKKNITTNVLRETLGRVHVGVQDLKTLNTRHHHGRGRKPAPADEL